MAREEAVRDARKGGEAIGGEGCRHAAVLRPNGTAAAEACASARRAP